MKHRNGPAIGGQGKAIDTTLWNQVDALRRSPLPEPTPAAMTLGECFSNALDQEGAP